MKINWYVVNISLSESLKSFHMTHKDNSGEELYKLLSSDNEFLENNQWINKFSLDYGVKSVDPFHIFASISSQKSSDEQRTNKIKVLFRLLDIEIIFDNIDFDGSPVLQTIKLLATRSLETEKEIWNFFIDVINDKKISKNFKTYQNWYGVDFENLSVILYWLDPLKYLPINYNTRMVLTHSILGVPKNFSEYISMTNEINKFNSDNNLIMQFYDYSFRLIFKQEKNISFNENFLKLFKK